MSPFPRRLLQRTLAIILVGGVLVTLCSWFVDRPVAFFVHDRGLDKLRVLEWFTLPPPIVQVWTPALLAIAVIAQALARRSAVAPRWTLVLLASCVALVVADQCCNSLRVVFGRDWPSTWIDDNPSLIDGGAYGFHLLHGSEEFGSFPSGHTTRTVAIASVVWIALPRWRWLCIVATVAIVAGLVGMNYHFVGDTIGGAMVGGIVGMYVAAAFGMDGQTHR